MKTRFFEGMIQNNNNNINIEKNRQISLLTNELDPEIIELIKKKDNEKNELSFAANLVKDYVIELKNEMKNNYGDDEENTPLLSLSKFNYKKLNSSKPLGFFNNIKKNENTNYLNNDKNPEINDIDDYMYKNYQKNLNKKRSHQHIKRYKMSIHNEDNSNYLKIFSKDNSEINNLNNQRLSEIQKRNEVVKRFSNNSLTKKSSHQNIKRYKISTPNEDNKNLILFPNSPLSNYKNQKLSEMQKINGVVKRFSNNSLTKKSSHQNIIRYKVNISNEDNNNNLNTSFNSKRSNQNVNNYSPKYINNQNYENINESKNKRKQNINISLNKKNSHQHIKHYKLNIPNEDFINIEKKQSFDIKFNEKYSYKNSKKFDSENDELSSKDYINDYNKINSKSSVKTNKMKKKVVKLPKQINKNENQGKKILKSFNRQPKSFSHKKYIKYNSIQSNKSAKTTKSKHVVKNSRTHIYHYKPINHYYENDIENNILYRKTGITNKNIELINELKKEIKETIIGETISIINHIDSKKSFLEKINTQNSENRINIIPKEDINILEQRYRNLQKKGYVYDSLDDEENIDEQMNLFYIDPNSNYIIFLDALITISSIFNLIYIPLFLGYNKIYCTNNFFQWDIIIEFIIDIIYIFDVIFSFFIAYYNFDEVLDTDLKDIAQKYLKHWFFWDLIQAIPIKSLLSIFDNKCKNNDYYNVTLYYDNFYYIFICLRLIKIIKVLSHNNLFFEKILNYLNETRHYMQFFKIYINFFIFLISIHIVANLFIFIGRIDYPNWIINYGYEDCSYLKLYLIAIYYSITTLTTVGYGDLLCITYKEKIFGLFMEIFGIIAYSWVVSSISNYVQGINEKNEDYENKCKILEEIKMTCPQLSDDLYDRINRYLKYKKDNEKLDKKIIFESLPIRLSNLLVCEMYKQIINDFIFFKNFDNIDFIVKVVLNLVPSLVVRNDILINYGDFVEEIIFVKKGKLSLELPLVLKPNKNIIKTNIKSSESSLIYQKKQQQYFDMFSRTKGKLINKKDLNEKNENENENEEIQVFKILELRKNEHFGDILMFLNLKSPLTLRTKTKKAELFYLHKTAAIEISTSYPLIWKQINKKSLYNYEQIKKLMNKVLRIFNNTHLTYVNTLEGENNLNSSISYESNESDNQSLSSFTNSNINDNSFNYKKIKSNKKGIQSSLQTISEIDDYESKHLFDLKDKKTITDDSSNMEDSVIDEELSREYNDTVSNSNIDSNSRNEKNKNDKYLTPFKPEEINEEIYPEDNYYLFNENESFNVNVRKSIVNNGNEFKNENNFYFNKINYNDTIKKYNNISICSTEISFTVNSEYENINELSDYNYSKDKKLRERVIDVLKKGEEKKEKDKIDKEVEFLSFEINSKSSIYSDNLIQNKRRNKKENSVSCFNISENIHNSLKKFHNNYELDNGKLNDKKRKNSSSKTNKTNLKVVHISKRKSLLASINKNIERNQINLNNPELYYAEYFYNLIEQKTKQKENGELNKEEEEFMNKLEKKSTFTNNTFRNNLKGSLMPEHM